MRSVARVTADLRDLGCYEVSLGDTIGVGTPKRAAALVRTLASEVPVSELAMHFHDTHGQALANIYACLEEGVRVLDSSAGGLGGCPYAPGASGNVATEDLLYMLDGLGFETGIDLDAVADASSSMLRLLGREAQSKAARAVGARTGLGACGLVDAGSAPAHA